ncbi:MAG TPA: PQQ-binding-like beta-propeller repeat protein, partial [Vicinamibacteria bacterium]
RTGALRWTFHPIPHEGEPGRESWETGTKLTGAANVWSTITADLARGWLFLPVSTATPDFYGGDRPGSNLYSDSVVALDAATGRRVWHFQTVHHDLWDYDVPAQPALFTLRREGRDLKALAQATKTGHLFILNRETGEPLFPVEERPVPQGAAPGEILSPTQPVPVRPPPLAVQSLSAEDAYGITPLGREKCRELIENMRSEGIFTPPSAEGNGTVLLPGSGGGLNWSGVAIDPERQILIVNATNLAWSVRLFPSDKFEEERRLDPDGEVRPQKGTPFGMSRSFLLSPLLFEVPCNPPPWGTLNAIDLATGDVKWKVELGSALLGPFETNIGLPSLGGAVVTRSGLAFIAGTTDQNFRAFDVESGKELWKVRLPAGGQATPMTYEVRLEDGRTRQFVVIAAGGQGRARTQLGDSLVAFALRD